MCFANSKFPLVDEMDHVEELLCLKFDEFLEFIVRLADMSTFKSLDTIKTFDDELKNETETNESLLYDKVFNLIDLILRLQNDRNIYLRAVKP